MPEIGVLCPSGDDETVEWNAPPFRDDLAASGIDIRDLRQDDFRVLLPTENTALGDAISPGDRPAVAT